MCCPENLAVSVNAIGVALAQGKTVDELALMSAVFMQLADTLATITAARSFCDNNQTKQSQQGQQGQQEQAKPPN